MEKPYDFNNLKRLMVEGDVDGDVLRCRYAAYADVDDGALEQLHERIRTGDDTATRPLQHDADGVTPATLRRWRRLRWAAAAVVVVAVSGALWFYQYAKVTPPELSPALQTAIKQSRESGCMEAMISLAPDPKEIVGGPGPEGMADAQPAGAQPGQPAGTSPSPTLTDAQPATAQPVHPAGTRRGTGTAQAPAKAGREPALLSALRVTTRSDKEFWLTLPDGSLVHLNYNTRVIYPERFTGGTREVYLEGEAYFMVSKDRRHPFIVHTPQGDVQVYGTEFMVKAQPSATPLPEVGTATAKSGTALQPPASADAATRPAAAGMAPAAVGEGAADAYVVLVRGSLGVTPTAGAEQMLQPGQRLSMNGTVTTIDDVDTAPYVAWNEGMFQFTNWPLERIVSVLSRWYGKQFAFAVDDLRHVKLSGNLYRYGQIGPTMRALEKVAGITVRERQNVMMIDY